MRRPCLTLLPCPIPPLTTRQITWAFHDKQEFIDIVETVYVGARKGRGLVVSPKGGSAGGGAVQRGGSEVGTPIHAHAPAHAAPAHAGPAHAPLHPSPLSDYSTKYRY